MRLPACDYVQNNTKGINQLLEVGDSHCIIGDFPFSMSIMFENFCTTW